MVHHTFDVVVFGASSFVGQILTRYLFEQYGVNGELNWAAAGRSLPKLKQLRNSLGSAAADLPLIQADSGSPAELLDMCSQARVIISTVGPYALYGESLVKICAESGTDYCDLTGEPQWIRRMIDRYDAAAQSSGARIVHCCGFDSIPSDLGVFFLQQVAMERFGQTCPLVKLRVKSMQGGFSGGTLASLTNVAKEAAADPQVRKLLADPYALCPPGPNRSEQHRVGVEYDADNDSWVAPFVMEAINSRIVHRSNALLGYPYGKSFSYNEGVLTGNGSGGRIGAMATAAGTSGMMLVAAISPLRKLLERFMPKPGEGPSEEDQRTGHFDLRIMGETADGRCLTVKVTGDRDPGYGSTAKMLGQAAICLAFDIHKDGGFWTPASVFGNVLIDRLCQHAGLGFEILE